jgi:hypothetical protein
MTHSPARLDVKGDAHLSDTNLCVEDMILFTRFKEPER